MKHFPASHTTGKPPQVGRLSTGERGFALVVTLTLMILLSILAIGMLSLSSTALRTSGSSQAMVQARSNARMALLVAIGELQAQMGPDQRISVPGGQRLAAADESGRKNWTGVYDSWPSTNEDRPAPVFRRWLLSGDQTAVSNITTVTGGNLASETAVLVGAIAASNPGSTGLVSSASGAVEAGIIPVKDGGYAWWIGDNHTKAKLGNISIPPADEKAALAQMQAAPQALAAPFLGTGVDRNDQRFGRLVSVETMNFLPSVLPANDQSLFHDATVTASGLVTDVRSGGFRKDLSFLLGKPYADTDKQPLYSVGSTPGMNFGELWADYNIWGELLTSGLPNHADGGTIPSGTPYLASPSNPADAHTDAFRKYRQPTRIRQMFIYSMISRPKPGTTTDEYDLFLVADPMVTMWNPFNVPYYLPSSVFTSFQNWAVPYRLTLVIKKPAGPVVWSANIPQITGTNFNQSRIGKGQALVMRPGEVQVLSQSYEDKLRTGGTIDAKLGWNFGAGFTYSLTVPQKDSAGTVTNPNGLGLPVINGTDELTFALEPTTNGQSHGIGLTQSIQYIGNEGPYPYGNFSVDGTTNFVNRNGDLASKDFPNVFRKIDRDASHSKTVSLMNAPEGTNGATKKWPLFMYTMDIRTEEDSYMDEVASLPPTSVPPRFTSRSLLSFNPKSFAYDLGNMSADYSRETPMHIGLRKLTSLNNVVEIAGAGLGYFGASHTASGNNNVVTHSVPRQPIFSIGALQNSLADGFKTDPSVTAGNTAFIRTWYLRPSISHAISNSFAPSIMQANETKVTRDQGTKWQRDLADHSFLANRALWDGYFFSSISSETTTAQKNTTTAYAEQKSRLTKFFNGGGDTASALPNPRMKPWVQVPQQAVDSIFNGNIPHPEAATRIGTNLIVDGAFNVNSTSVAAWKSMLGALKGTPVAVRGPNASSSNAVLTNTEETPVASLLPSSGNEIDSSGLSSFSSPEQWLGFRALTDAQLDELANAIVKQVRLRGPFTSLSDFVNRRPGNDKALAVSGTLQSALDDPSVSINAGYRTGKRSLSTTDASTQGFQFPEAAAGAKSAGAPGYVKQGDLLTPLGPLITVRGDTFTIRTYGDHRNAAGKIIAKAYCEAVVQRLPEYVDASDAATLQTPLSPVNKRFGRRFSVISLRYLRETEL